MIKKITIVLLVLIVAAYVLSRFTKRPEPFPAGSESALLLEAGRFEVEETDFSVRDLSRQTQSHQRLSGYEGLPYRKFEVTVWSPKIKAKGGHPLLVYSHGLMSTRDDLEYVVRHLASHGYIVLAADYPLTSRGSGEALLIDDVVNQPEDIRFLIDQVISTDTEMGAAFSAFINADRIGAFGYSLGGLTSTLAIFHPEMSDPRIKAALSVAGPSAMLAERFFQNRSVPFLMLAGTLDAIVPYKDHAQVIPDRVGSSRLVTITGGTHIGFAGMSEYMRWWSNADSLTCGLMNFTMKKMDIKRGAAEKAWYPLIGTHEQGVVADEASVSCPHHAEAPAAINPLKQHMITKVAVLAFFNSLFSDTEAKRIRADKFLSDLLSRENASVRVEPAHNRMQ